MASVSAGASTALGVSRLDQRRDDSTHSIPGKLESITQRNGQSKDRGSRGGNGIAQMELERHPRFIDDFTPALRRLSALCADIRVGRNRSRLKA
jgi:hypothetical protein